MAKFREQYPDMGGGDWVSGDEKDVMIEQGIPFTILAVQEDPANKYGPRFVLSILLPDPETGEESEKKIGFAQGTVESRDRDLYAYQKFLAEGGDPETVKLTKSGNSQLIEFED